MGNKQYNIENQDISKFNSKLLYVTKANYDVDWDSIQHSHPFTELFYVLKGEGDFYVEEDVFHVYEDDLVIVNANSLHTEKGYRDKPLEYIVLGIDGLSFLTDDDEKNTNYTIHNYQDYKHEILFYLKTLLIEAENKSEYYNTISQNLLEILLINIKRRTKSKLVITANRINNRETAYIKQYIEANFKKNINLDKLCEVSFMNKYYLEHSFKKAYGISPINYLTKIRIKEANSLLDTTDLTISQIADIVGFSSHSYFNQVYKKMMGIRPLERRNSKKK